MQDTFSKFVVLCVLLFSVFLVGLAVGGSVRERDYKSMLAKEKHAAYKEETGEWYLKTWSEK
jgi:aspartyl/asparaginyl-tRNA synthetase